ncbi:hypothetical protein MMC07_008343 [Pseudocyphellaria aurata]|nr:hypothetical protein [Pseudocyphellaria aurata]
MSDQNQPAANTVEQEELPQEWLAFEDDFQDHMRRMAIEFPYYHWSPEDYNLHRRGYLRLLYELSQYRDSLEADLQADLQAANIPGSTSPSPSVFVAGLPVVETAPEQTCPICLNRYDSTPSSSEDTLEKEPALELPCKHVVGRSCLRTWLQGGNKTCPFCRVDVYAATPTE